MEKSTTPQKAAFEIKNLFTNIENTVAFIQTSDEPQRKAKQIIAKILSHTPKTFIVCSSGLAMEKCEEIKSTVMSEINDYEVESFHSANKKIYFFNKKEVIL